MLKTDKRKFLTQELMKYAGERQGVKLAGYITTKELAEFMGHKDPAVARPYTYGCDKVGTRYLIPEVVERILG